MSKKKKRGFVSHQKVKITSKVKRNFFEEQMLMFDEMKKRLGIK